jgi:L-alanine-DL-glutamate epimerase-like enolase superfamily enzyme
MAGVTPQCSPGKLASLLEALEVRVESATVERGSVALPDYPGGPRPSSLVRLSGAGFVGVGENVAFFAEEHERFAAHIAHWFAAHSRAPRQRVGMALGGAPYERAALQAALIDLGLRQAGLSLSDLTGVREASLRFVISLAASAQPVATIRRLRGEGYGADLKLDVDPSWTARTLEVLAQDLSIAIFDFKGRGELALARHLDAVSPAALFEDPPSGFAAADSGPGPTRVSRDATLPDEAAVAEARARGESVNLKAPRMGGPLAVLRALEHALESASATDAAVRAYLGGMFEVNVGRAQARQLAALYCPTAPNDLALNLAHVGMPGERAASPARVRLDRPGFGAS